MRESVRIRNGAEGKIENEIFRVREKRLAIAVAAPNDLAVAIIDAGDLRNACRRRKRTKGDYFNGQRKRAKGRDDFRGVGNDDHLVRSSRNDLLAQQRAATARSEAHTSELQSLMRTSYAVFCLKKTQQQTTMKLQ